MTNKQLQHIAAINSPDKWFAYPLMPLTKKANGDFPTLGVIHKDNLTTVKFANLFMLPLDKKSFNELPGEEYSSIEDLVNDGWEVD